MVGTLNRVHCGGCTRCISDAIFGQYNSLWFYYRFITRFILFQSHGITLKIRNSFFDIISSVCKQWLYRNTVTLDPAGATEIDFLNISQWKSMQRHISVRTDFSVSRCEYTDYILIQILISRKLCSKHFKVVVYWKPFTDSHILCSYYDEYLLYTRFYNIQSSRLSRIRLYINWANTQSFVLTVNSENGL